MTPAESRYFDSILAFRAWLDVHHRHAPPLWVAIAKKGCAHHVLQHQDALDAALCYGWIDGAVKRIDHEHYALRFSQRRAGSNWSVVNVHRFHQLQEANHVHASGLAAFECRDRKVSEDTPAQLTEADQAVFKANPAACAFMERQPQGYRRQASWYVLSARTEATRQRRLATLIALCAAEKRLPGYG